MLFFDLDHRQAAKGERYRKQRQLPKNRSQFCPLKTESKKKRTPTFANAVRPIANFANYRTANKQQLLSSTYLLELTRELMVTNYGDVKTILSPYSFIAVLCLFAVAPVNAPAQQWLANLPKKSAQEMTFKDVQKAFQEYSQQHPVPHRPDLFVPARSPDKPRPGSSVLICPSPR
jgi:hypothetical protein